MTLFGHDVSSYNPDYIPRPGEFVIVKASEGARTHDPSWGSLSARVKAAGAYLMAYHFLHSDSDPAEQAANTADVPGAKDVPLMVDVETEGTSKPTIAQCAQYVDAARGLGLNPRLVYLPRWYWQQIGSPSLQPLISRGLHLVSSAYPQQGHYPGDSGSGWDSYGGMTPLIWQYSSVPLDCDAFKGTLADLMTALGDGGDDMPLTNADADLVAARLAKNTTFLDALATAVADKMVTSPYRDALAGAGEYWDARAEDPSIPLPTGDNLPMVVGQVALRRAAQTKRDAAFQQLLEQTVTGALASGVIKVDVTVNGKTGA